MSPLVGKTVEELIKIKVRGRIVMERRREGVHCHHGQVLRKERLMIFLFSNNVFSFAGNITLYMSSLLAISQCVTLSLDAQFIERVSMEGRHKHGMNCNA